MKNSRNISEIGLEREMATDHTFGPFHLDAEAGILFRGGEPLALGQRAISLLRVLLEHSGTPVSKDTLIEAAWSGLAIEESNLSVQIAALRRALRVAPSGENWIETLPRRGYRYIGPTAIERRSCEEPTPQKIGVFSTFTTSIAPRLSIVVLPFANIGGDREQDYFVDGVTESLTTDLSRMGTALVVARSSAFSYSGNMIDVRQVGRELNVRHVVQGSIQRSGNLLRVNVQLVDVESGKHLWADSFERPVADLLEMQDAIVSRLAHTLGDQLVVAEARRAEQSQHPGTLDLTFQGHACLYKGSSSEHFTQARDFFERALAIDHRTIGALVGIALVDLRMGASLMTDDRTALFSTAEVNVIKALSLAPDHALAHVTLGSVCIFTNRATQGIAECEHALQLNRNLAVAHSTIGLAKYFMGQPAETEGHILEAIRLSPRDTRTYQWMDWLGAAKVQLGADVEAVAWLRRSIEANRNFPVSHFALAAALGLLGAIDEARTATKAALALNPSYTIRRLRTHKFSDNPTYLAGRERICEGMRLAGVPEG
jgi:TolB-like protein